MNPEQAPQQPQSEARRQHLLLDQMIAEQAQVASRYMPVMEIEQAIKRREAIRQLKDLVLVEGEDYGVIPGTGTADKPAKPTLLKPGAEKICAFFGYVPTFSVMPGSIEDWTGEQYGEPLFYYHVTCTILKDGHPVGAGTGSCSSWERKYRYRSAKRTCPSCGATALIKGKPEYEKGDYKTRGSFICFEKKGGCGAKFYGDDPAVMNQPLGEVPNPDFADIINTVQKMADKRAYIAATLSATGASQWFSQDLEDIEREAQTIDTGGAPIGTKQAAQNVAERRIKDLEAQKQASTPPATVVEMPPPPAPPIAGEKTRPAPWSDMSRMFEHFQQCKDQLGEPRYRQILKEHGIDSAAAFKRLYGSQIPAAIYWQMEAEIDAKYPDEEPPNPPEINVIDEINALAAKHRIGQLEASLKLAQLGYKVASAVPPEMLQLIDAAFAEVTKEKGGAV